MAGWVSHTTTLMILSPNFALRFTLEAWYVTVVISLNTSYGLSIRPGIFCPLVAP